MEELVKPFDPKVIENNLREFAALLEKETSGGYEVYLLDPNRNKLFNRREILQTPLFQELGRVREETFRIVGEGTGRSLDLDPSIDTRFCQIILWDPKEKRIAGGYRAGIGPTMELADLYNLQVGFRFSRSFRRYLKRGVEFGRSFVTTEYQTKTGFHSLWQGIHRFIKYLQTTDFPEIRYLFGGISISSQIPYTFSDRIIFLFQKSFPGKRFRFRNPIIAGGENVYCFQSPEEDLESYFRLEGEKDTRRAYVKRSLRLMKDMKREGYKFPVLFASYADLCGEDGSLFSVAVQNKHREGALEVAFINDLYYLNPAQDKIFTDKQGYSILSHVRQFQKS